MAKEPKANRLIEETSPYLLQHAHSAVDWYPWGKEAFERARRENKPIFLSIGYSACHWCHVMARESFENEEIARFLNERFVCIKVDREERPDVDAIYINAVQLMTGGGGWPLSVFLTPEGKPFYGGTYFPPDDRGGMPGFRKVIEEIARFYEARRSDVNLAADKVTRPLEDFCDIGPRGRTDTEISRTYLDVAFRNISAAFDGEWGGFGAAPKFPQPTALEWLLRYLAETGEPHARSMVELTLDRMARGGIYDQIGGGFHRYSTDRQWTIPHFEKMLDDNALLAGVYLDAFLVTGKALYERIARETLDYLLREMAGPEGAFYCAQDSDNRQGEGEFYVWTAKEIRAVLGAEDAEVLLRHYGVGAVGNFEGARSVLTVVETPEQIAARTGRTVGEIEDAIARGRRALFEIRSERHTPPTDDKVIAAWNGLAISAMARAGAALGEDRWIRAAKQCADFILVRMRRDDGGLWRLYRAGKTRRKGFLPDYALLVGGLLDLYEATFEIRYLAQAVALAEAMVERFWDEMEKGFFFAEKEQGEPRIVAFKDSFDQPDPSGNAAAVCDLLRLAELTGREEWREKALVTLRLFIPSIVRSPLNMGRMLEALDFYTAPPATVVIAGSRNDPAARALIEVVHRTFAPNKVVAFADGSNRTELERSVRLIPSLEGKEPREKQPCAYICRGRTCSAPITEPAELAAHLRPRPSKKPKQKSE